MKLKREVVDLSRERILVSLLITSDEFSKKVLPIVDVKSFKVAYSRTVYEWCKEYWDAYGCAPKSTIQDIYERKRTYVQDSDLLESIGAFLTSLSEDFNPDDYHNVEYYIKDAERYIRENSIAGLSEKLTALVQQGKLDQAEQAIGQFTRPCIPEMQGVSLIENMDIIMDSFSEETIEPLVALDGALGKVVGKQYRGDLLAAVSRMKGTKSWYLAYVDECAALAGNRVLHINLEMRDNEMYQRQWRGLVRQPMRDMEVTLPYFVPELDVGEVETELTMNSVAYNKVEKKGVSFDNREQLKQTMAMRFHGGDIRYVTLPSYSTTVLDIESLIDNLSLYNGYNVDVLTIDYCDLLGSNEKEYRHRLNDIWINLRRLAQARNILVSTVTQTVKEGTKGEELDASSISEDIRKLAHATTFLGIYGTREEFEKQICHVTCIDTRYRRETYDNAIVLNCLDIGRWYLDSRLEKTVLT